MLPARSAGARELVEARLQPRSVRPPLRRLRLHRQRSASLGRRGGGEAAVPPPAARRARRGAEPVLCNHADPLRHPEGRPAARPLHLPRGRAAGLAADGADPQLSRPRRAVSLSRRGAAARACRLGGGCAVEDPAAHARLARGDELRPVQPLPAARQGDGGWVRRRAAGAARVPRQGGPLRQGGGPVLAQPSRGGCPRRHRGKARRRLPHRRDAAGPRGVILENRERPRSTHAHGGTRAPKRARSLQDQASFSFFPSFCVGCGRWQISQKFFLF
mmetsp:Transcript_8843/g.29145  ORF Transcript_8843/g.29145 Transcript_8843/m.29145 type:complete len:274 (-) Transcript_8843:6-827(-)